MVARKLFVVLILGALTFGCGDQKADDSKPDSKPALVTTIVASGLMNPSSVSFSPAGELTICDSGNGRVVVLREGKLVDYITDFDTEYWKIDKKAGINRFKLGPLSAIWLKDTLVVSDGGKKDGQETLLFFDGPGKASAGTPTNTMVPEGVEAAKGEGNLCGMSATADEKTIYLCGQGQDDHSWLLSCDVATKKLKVFASADLNSILINSPMQVLNWDADHVLGLYSGKGGTDDGLIVKWNKKTAKPVAQWTLTGLTDPMGMARFPGSDELAVVDNNWALTEVKAGRLARVTLGENGSATVKVVDVPLLGPVSCVFGPNGNLFVAQLGAKFDSDKGEVIRIKGL